MVLTKFNRGNYRSENFGVKVLQNFGVKVLEKDYYQELQLQKESLCFFIYQAKEYQGMYGLGRFATI